MVWLNALVASAGGAVLRDPEAGKEARPALDSAAGRRAAAVVRALADAPAANPALATADEEVARAAFQGSRGGFMVNWPYVLRGGRRRRWRTAALDPDVVADIGWARYPRVDAGMMPAARRSAGSTSPSAPSAARVRWRPRRSGCLTSTSSQAAYMVDAGNPAARAAVYDDAAVRRSFPMADLIRASIDGAAPRPQTPYYTDVSAARGAVLPPSRRRRPGAHPGTRGQAHRGACSTIACCCDRRRRRGRRADRASGAAPGLAAHGPGRGRHAGGHGLPHARRALAVALQLPPHRSRRPGARGPAQLRASSWATRCGGRTCARPCSSRWSRWRWSSCWA